MQRDPWMRNVPVITVLFLVINIVIFVIQELFLTEEMAVWLYANGALYGTAVLEGGQYYRLFSSMFLHFDSEHLMNNMMILFLIGSRLERQMGKVRYVIVYFLTGILAGIASIGYNILQERLVISVGASGAVFGLVGALVWVVIAHRGRVQGLTGRQMLVFAAVSLYGGFANPQTDNAAHVGGLLAGLFLALLLYRRKPVDRRAVDTADCEEI